MRNFHEEQSSVSLTIDRDAVDPKIATHMNFSLAQKFKLTATRIKVCPANFA